MSEQIVAKFGGTSMAQPEVVAGIVEARPDQQVIVVSAPGTDTQTDTKMTDMLEAYGAVVLGPDRSAAQGQRDEIIDRFDTVYGVLGAADRQELRAKANSLLTPSAKDNPMYYMRLGEVLSAWAFARLVGADYLDPAIISEEDRRVAKLALKTRKPVFLVVNKSDKAHGALATNYQNLGIKPIILTAAIHNRGVKELLDLQVAALPKASIKEASDRLHVALLGRPNVGKSYLFNTLARKQQAIVADRAGTTRDINRTTVKFMSREIELLDTAGIRRSGKVEPGVEKFSVLRSLSAIEEADICLLLIDVNEPAVQLDQKIAGMVQEAGKGLVLVITKWDTQEDSKTPFTRDQLAATIRDDFAFVAWAPLIFTSAVTGQNAAKLFELAVDIDQRRQQKITTSQLNQWLRDTVQSHPPAGLKNRSPKLNYIIQESDNPTNFKVYGAHTKFLHWSYKRFMDRRLREKYDLVGTPVKFWFFDKHITHKHGQRP